MSSDRPARIVLLPGIDGTGRLFRRFERQLDGRLASEVVAYPIDRPFSYAQLIDRVLGELGDAPAIVLGESFSGPIAIEVAARRPSQITGLVLAATFVTAPMLPALIRLGAMLGPRLLPLALVHAVLRGRRPDPELAAEIDALLGELPHAVLAMRLREVAGVDARPALRRVRCPVLVLHGAQDWLVRPVEARETLGVKPDAVARFLPGPHTILQSAPEAAAREILEFVRARCGAGQDGPSTETA